MLKRKILNWAGYFTFLAVQIGYVWTLFVYIPSVTSWYMDWSATKNDSFIIPGSIQGFINSYHFFSNSLFFWAPLWATIITLLPFLVWRFRQRSWPFWVLLGLATLHLAYYLTMIVITEQHMAYVTGMGAVV